MRCASGAKGGREREAEARVAGRRAGLVPVELALCLPRDHRLHFGLAASLRGGVGIAACRSFCVHVGALGKQRGGGGRAAARKGGRGGRGRKGAGHGSALGKGLCFSAGKPHRRPAVGVRPAHAHELSRSAEFTNGHAELARFVQEALYSAPLAHHCSLCRVLVGRANKGDGWRRECCCSNTSRRARVAASHGYREFSTSIPW